jgi:hypothetical protein
MKKILLVFTILLTFLGVTGRTNAATINFEDIIDYWHVPVLGEVDSIPIVEGIPLTYTHDINDDVNIAAGDLVTSASLELDFTNDLFDTVFTGLLRWMPDLTEYVSYGFDGSAWTEIGEVDNGQYLVSLDAALLNDDGKLNVVLYVTNYDNGLGTAYLDHSRLFGTAETAAPVPEPATMILLGSGLIGLSVFRKRFIKKN